MERSAGSGSRGKAKAAIDAAGEAGAGEAKPAAEWKNLNRMTVTDVSSLSTSRSGRKLHKPCDFWRQQVAVERALLGGEGCVWKGAGGCGRVREGAGGRRSARVLCAGVWCAE